MMNCWQQDPDLRPAFESLQKNLKDLEQQHKVFHCSEYNLCKTNIIGHHAGVAFYLIHIQIKKTVELTKHQKL